MYDASCAVNTPIFDDLTTIAYYVWSSSPSTLLSTSVGQHAHINLPTVLGHHFFIANPITGVGLSPEWNFGDKGFVVGAKTGDVPAPNSTVDVDLLSLSAVEGTLASQIFRVETKGGQPPATVRDLLAKACL